MFNTILCDHLAIPGERSMEDPCAILNLPGLFLALVSVSESVGCNHSAGDMIQKHALAFNKSRLPSH